ncbi:MAG: hypothetical protein A2Y23_00130 [Clostridiales bacterium GWB2_37_7]|nr:MAG: hypothetical protein A2Y23_00130 [Clostridiales bacterium GWB2_37_7]
MPFLFGVSNATELSTYLIMQLGICKLFPIDNGNLIQITLLPDCIADYIGVDNPVRVKDNSKAIKNVFHAFVKDGCH